MENVIKHPEAERKRGRPKVVKVDTTAVFDVRHKLGEMEIGRPYTQREFGDKLGTSEHAVYLMERDKRYPGGGGGRAAFKAAADRAGVEVPGL